MKIFYKKRKNVKNDGKGDENFELKLAKNVKKMKLCTVVAEKMHKIVRIKRTTVQMHKN